MTIARIARAATPALLLALSTFAATASAAIRPAPGPLAEVKFATPALELTEGQTRDVVITRPRGEELGNGAVIVRSTPVSATQGTDFTSVADVFRIDAGQTEISVPVQALADTLKEGPETFTLMLEPRAGDVEVSEPATAVVTIRDPETADGPGGPRDDDGRGRTPDTNGLDDDGSTPGADLTAPVVSRVTVSKTAFTARRGAMIRYTLSEPAAVTVLVERAAAGRRVGRACRAVTARTRGARPCRRFVPTGTVRSDGVADANRLALRKRVGGRALRSGRHRLVVTAIDAAGNGGAARPRAFRVLVP